MTAYTVTNSRGNTVTTINVSTTTGYSFPVELVGQGISLYGPIMAQNQYRQLENFAKANDLLIVIIFNTCINTCTGTAYNCGVKLRRTKRNKF